jgi:hypothetical protein
MKAGRVGATMEEECREILHCVEEAIAQEMRGGAGIPTDGARMAACLHLQRAAQSSVTMPANRRPRLLPRRSQQKTAVPDRELWMALFGGPGRDLRTLISERPQA